MFKVIKGVAPAFMTDIFAKNENTFTENVSSNTHSRSIFYNPSNPKKVNYGLETLRSLGPNVWDMLPIDLKNSPWHDIFVGVPQGSNLGPLLFNVYINDIFFIMKDVKIANYADDNSPFMYNKCINEVLKLLEEESNKLYSWYEVNWLKPNVDKYLCF